MGRFTEFIGVDKQLKSMSGASRDRQPDADATLKGILGLQEEFLLPHSMVTSPEIEKLRRAGKFRQAGRLQDRLIDDRVAESGLSKAGFLAQGQMEEQLNLSNLFGSQIIREQARLRDEAINADPLARAARDSALESLQNQQRLSSQLFESAGSGLADLDNDGLPDDIQRNIEQSTRSALAARGLSESGAGGTLEALALIGGREGLRNQRLAQAQSILSGGQITSRPGLAFANPNTGGQLSPTSFFPGSGQLTAFGGGAFGGQMQAAMASAAMQNENLQGAGAGIGGLAGMTMLSQFGGF